MKQIIITILGLLVVVGSGVHAEIYYTIEDLGLGKAYAINDVGQVVGYSGIVQGPEAGRRAFLWSNGTLTNLGTLGGDHSEAYDINNSGQMVGRTTMASGEDDMRGFLWQNDIMTDLGTLSGNWTEAHGINELGQITGYSVLSGSVSGFFWENSSMTDIGSLSDSSRGYAINDAGQIVGDCFGSNYDTTACLWEKDTITSLGTLGGKYSYAYDINNEGHVVGSSLLGEVPDYSHAFLWENEVDGMIDLGLGEAEALNDVRQVVGSFGLWEDGTTTALLDLLADSSGWYDLYAKDINNSGQIVGSGMIDDEIHAFLMTPVPEPCTLALLGLGGIFLRRIN